MSPMHTTKQESDGKGTETSSAKPKQRIRAARRPRLLPVPVRQKLLQLGHTPSSNETSRDNLSVIIDRLTTDLTNYRDLAEHWQQKYIDLKNAKSGDSSPSGSLESHRGFAEVCGILQDSPSHSSDEMSSMSSHLLGRLDSTANPSLSLVALGAPRVHSDVSRIVSESTFLAAITAIEIMSSLHATPAPDMNANPRIILVKPDFDNHTALQIWNNIFEPMNFQPSSMLFDSAPSSRRELEYDSDTDHFDRVLAQSSDSEIVDMLQYATLMLGGMHQIVFDDPSKASARIHIGKSIERILREAIFTRNLTANPLVAKSLLNGLVGSFCHFATQEMPSAVLSVVNLAWLVFSQHSERFHPTNRIFISFYALVLEPSESQRKIWMQRVNEGLALSEPSKPFLAVLMAAFAGAYNALLGHDEAEVLQYIATLDEILAPSAEPNEQVVEQYELDHFHAVYAKPPSTGTHSPPSTQSPSCTESTDYYDPSDFNYNFENDETLLSEWITPQLTSEEPSEGLVPADEWMESSSAFLDEYGRTFTPGENLKSIFRIPLLLIRAEAALAIQDFETCMHWVDEAEKTMLAIPLNYMLQRVFLMKNVIKTTCPFPTGERNVVDEFERRMLAHDSAQSGRPAGEHGRVGALWRTP